MKGLNTYAGNCALLGRREKGGNGMERLKASACKVVGARQVLRGLKAGTLACVYVANDADTFLYQRVRAAAENARVPVVRAESMKALGECSGVDVPTAAAAILK